MNGHRQHTALKTMRQYNCTSSTRCVGQTSCRMRQKRNKTPTTTMIVRRVLHKATRKEITTCRVLHKISQFKSSAQHKPPKQRMKSPTKQQTQAKTGFSTPNITKKSQCATDSRNIRLLMISQTSKDSTRKK